MLFKRDVVEKISRNPLPAEIRKRSDLIKGLYYFYGIGCREDEWLAEIFWQGRIIAAEMPGTESDIADYPLWSPERVFRTAMLYGPDTAGLQEGLSADLPGDMTRLGIQWLKSQEKYFQIESEISESDLRRAYCQSYLEDLPYYVWEGFDYQDPRPELVLHQADEIYDTGSDEDWRENVESCRGICYSAGSCFGLYKAAEKLYRLAAIGGNLRAIETDVGCGCRGSERSRAKGRQSADTGKPEGSSPMVEKIGRRRKSFRDAGADFCSGDMGGSSGQERTSGLLAKETVGMLLLTTAAGKMVKRPEQRISVFCIYRKNKKCKAEGK